MTTPKDSERETMEIRAYAVEKDAFENATPLFAADLLAFVRSEIKRARDEIDEKVNAMIDGIQSDNAYKVIDGYERIKEILDEVLGDGK